MAFGRLPVEDDQVERVFNRARAVRTGETPPMRSPRNKPVINPPKCAAMLTWGV
jgi:hypothetical protein